MDDYSNARAGTTAEHYYRSVSPPSRVSSSCSPPPPFAPPAAHQLVGNVAPTVVMSPCAACKMLRRRCADGCVLAPYFPPTEPAKFTTAHRVFGASNIIKLLQVRVVRAPSPCIIHGLFCLCLAIYAWQRADIRGFARRICQRARGRTR
jgi:hypothetical protein